jgi:hypothetical protein
MLNNKGQSLILFILILPIILLILILVIDVGRMIVLKNELDSISGIALEYGLERLDADDLEIKIKNLIELNIKDIDDIEIVFEEEKIFLNISEKNDGILSGFVNISAFDINVSYVGYLVDGEKIIEKMGD